MAYFEINNRVKQLPSSRKRRLKRGIVHVLVICVLLLRAPLGLAEDRDHPDGKGGATKGSVPKAPPPPAPRERGVGSSPSLRRGGDEGCPVNTQGLADFANGERYDYPNMVTYLTNSQCVGNARQIGLAALSQGVVFIDKPPFRLDNFAKALPRVDLESAKRMERTLAKTIPGLLRVNPLSSSEMLPLLGQLALLSPSAAKGTLAAVIEQELYAGDQRLIAEGQNGAEVVATDIARTLVRLGANESAIASEMAEGIEEMALVAQADSLASIFRALSAAATIDASLVPTFNLSAGAMNRGVQRGKTIYVNADRAALLVAVFTAIRSSMKGTGALEPGAAELNEALAALLEETAFTATALKRLWKEAVKILVLSTSQSALALAIAYSITPQVVFLLPEDLMQILYAARNYSSVAGAVQANFLIAWQRTWSDLHEKRISVKAFNRMKERYFEPLVTGILDLDPYLIDSIWLREVIRRGMIQDEDIEKRFPRFVLSYLDRQEKASKTAAVETGLESTVSSLSENFTVLWTLSNVHIPTLMKWIKKFEQ